jgi:hypothetical protein
VAIKSYRSLASNSRFLKGIAFDSGSSNLTNEDRVEAENDAAQEIDRELATTFSTTDTPGVVRLLADLLGSAFILDYLALSKNFGEEGEGARKPKYLRDRAAKIIEDLRAHAIGIQNPDGSWNALYPQPNVLPSIEEGEAQPVTVDRGLSWGQMAPPAMSDNEKRALDTERGRRADEQEAALAGAYGL